MDLTNTVIDVGTETISIVSPSNDFAKYALKNMQPETVMEYARDGYIFLVNAQFSITAGASVNFSMLTGDNGAQLDFYSMVTETSAVYAELIEGATIVTTGDPISAYNLNRKASDTYSSVLKAASSITGGTTISAEFLPASNQSAGNMASSKIHTLEANTEYGMKFSNIGSQTTRVHFQLGFSEHYNGLNDIWLGALDTSFVLKAGDELIMELPPLAAINATSKIDSNKLSVMRIV
jgi:hypothetical protein